MIPTIIQLEDNIINEIALQEPGIFTIWLEYDDDAGNTLTCEVDGYLNLDDGQVRVSDYETNLCDSDGNDIDCPCRLDIARIERKSASKIREAISEAIDIRNTEDMLSWGGWFV